MAAVTHIGNAESLRFSVKWAEPADGDAESRTRGAATLEVGGHVVWGSPDEPFEWTWIELLEFLAESWRFLLWEETYPEGLAPRNPLVLEDAFETRREDMHPAAAAALHEDVVSFVEHHDMASALRGAIAPPIRILREGLSCSLTTRFGTTTLPFEDVTQALESIASALLTRLDGAEDPRSVRAIADWEQRASVTEKFLLEFAASLPSSHWSTLRGRLPDDPGGWGQLEVFAAARMAGSLLDTTSFEKLLASIESVPHSQTGKLDALSRKAQEHLRPRDRAFLEGYATARAMRPELGHVDEQGCIDIEAILASLDVTVSDVDLKTDSLDAIAVFGPKHGPAVLVNSSGVHSKGPRGRRTTLAHELCHLLLDRDSSLPLVEVLGGRLPRRPEQRANAFAAELLVPSHEVVAATRKESPTSLGDWEALVEAIGRRFKASRAVAAWQTLNANAADGESLAPSVRSRLESLTRDS